MSLISERPERWNEVYGQPEVLHLLHSLLRTPRFLVRGVIFEGPYAVGKTSCAYLFARALMCLGEDPLGCGKCASCLTMDETTFRDSTLRHPAFIEIDAASCSGVQAARDLLSRVLDPPTGARRRVVLIDEAHRLSADAWDVFLKPLEIKDTSVMFVFVTSEENRVPQTIASRCAHLKFGLVNEADLTGKLMAVAERENISYTMDGLRLLAHMAQGRPRNAVLNLGMVAATGSVTREVVESLLRHDAKFAVQMALQAILEEDLLTMVSTADALAQRVGPVKAIQEFFSFFCADVFAGARFASAFAPMSVMSSFFLKWCQISHLPSDIIPLFVLELSDLRATHYQARKNDRSTAQYEHVPVLHLPGNSGPSAQADREIHYDELKAMMEN